jgi:hypothetical protein
MHNQNNYKLAKACAKSDIEEDISDANYKRLHSNYESVTMLNLKSPDSPDNSGQTQDAGWDGYIEECHTYPSKKKIIA